MSYEEDLSEKVQFEIVDQVAWITINNPDKGNAMSPGMRDRMTGLFESLNGQFDARAVVLTATGQKLFCPGADISVGREYAQRPDDAPALAVGEPRRMMLRGQHPLMSSILDCELPVIAAVNGTAAGMGVHLALMCDLVMMADHAKFIEVFARRGLVPDAMGTWILPRLIGPMKTKELMFFADDIPADYALELGLCNKVVASEELIPSVMEWAVRLATGPTKAHMFTKWLVNRSLDVDRRTITEEESWAVELNNGTMDAQEGVNSFRERRDPYWRGF
ncbi:MAG: enoyl-CoA hydratase/isomerase family protein [Actinomycetota bacterium]|nr:enoyl-CoA hydratase/isomerase family protein [Actinomycetota bacterium]MEC7530753.1 enoyl-CoA hydratase/isomerase family protein [Actinomycetota bacterium]MEC7607231.1 enoyl-CoA hydratase/isomerase family protein [Actinomycetota bacterium]MEC8118835.1 enoyl-CoA hydratase/isomerase family protein [Actinomycetota bacterium]MEC8333835.1 enoyl-CoA hydratase/isomerase family protein [Actinomycetota bacterium]|tara:strand:- start:37 stop:867 length:831 start_codon:yes stop_codon:yes gene_type:complete